MPLDALSGTAGAESLAISLEQWDIKPVDWNTLAAHKQAQFERLEISGVPEPIAAMARSMHRKVPGSSVILGTLVRESVVLDPYLLLVRDEERVCLGLWD